MKKPFHGSGIRYVRELVSREIRPKGVSSRFFERVASGAVEKISHAAYKKFRNEYSRRVYAIFTSHNVKPVVVRYTQEGNRYRTRVAEKGLSLDELDFAAKQTDFGRTWEHASNDVITWKENFIKDVAEEEEIPPEKVKIPSEKIVDYMEDEYREEIKDLHIKYNRLAGVIVTNNGLFETWKKEGRKFINREGRICTKQDAVEHMEEIMAFGFRDEPDWEEYVVERHNIEHWHPVAFIYDKTAKKTVRSFVPEGNPKYAEWQKRLSSGKIVRI